MRRRRTYQNKGQKRRIAMSKSTGRLRSLLTPWVSRVRTGFKARLGWQGKFKSYSRLKRKRYYPKSWKK